MHDNKKLKELYLSLAEKRIDSKLADIQAAIPNMDSETVVFTRGQLEGLETTIYETLFQPLQTLSMIPVSTEFAPGLTVISYRFSEKTGEAETITRKDQVRPDIDEHLTKFPQEVVEGGASYHYDIGDVESGALLDYDQVNGKARAAVEAVARWHDRRALDGEPGIFEGFANTSTVPTPTLVDADWGTVTPDDLYQTVAQFLNSVEEATEGNFIATSCLMPIAVFNRLTSTRFDNVTGDTVMKVLKENFPNTRFEKFTALAGRGAGGTDRMIAGDLSPRVLQYRATVVYDEAAPDKKGFSWTVECRGRSGGTVIRYPLAMAYGDIANA